MWKCEVASGNLHTKLETHSQLFYNYKQKRIFEMLSNETVDCNAIQKLHNAELYDLHSSPNIIRMIKTCSVTWAGRVARMGERRGVYRVLVGRPEGKRPLGTPRRRWEDNIKMDLQEVG